MNDGRETASQDHPKQGQGTGIEASKAGAPIYLVATGLSNGGEETYTRHEGHPPPLCDYEGPLYASQAVPEVRPQSISEPADDGCCVLCGLHMSIPAELDPTEVCNECAQAFYAAHAAHPISEQGSDRVRDMIAMVDAAMVEMANIHPSLRRSECERLIRAALAV